MNIDVETLKASHNIVDVIGRYVPLKRSGQNHFGLCPFHSEKSPSFSVNEKDQFYHCFGCPAAGDVVKFVMDYAGLEFVDACKELGAEVEVMPTKKVEQNRKAALNRVSYSVPIDHRQNAQKSQEFIKGMLKFGALRLKKHDSDDLYIPMLDFNNGEPVNIVKTNLKNEILGFLAGGLSYGCFGYLKGTTDHRVAVTSISDGLEIWNQRGKKPHVYICFSDSNLEYVCDYAKPKDLKITPVLTMYDDDKLAYEMPCYFWHERKLTKWKENQNAI